MEVGIPSAFTRGGGRRNKAPSEKEYDSHPGGSDIRGIPTDRSLS
jgi:hypothetical protein